MSSSQPQRRTARLGCRNLASDGALPGPGSMPGRQAVGPTGVRDPALATSRAQTAPLGAQGFGGALMSRGEGGGRRAYEIRSRLALRSDAQTECSAPCLAQALLLASGVYAPRGDAR